MKNSNPRHVGTLSPEMALLGLLFDDVGHGYDLHRKVNTELGHVWHLSQSQAYSILKRLEARGDVSVQEISQEKLPSRQALCITPAGRKRFLDWLTTETPSGSSTRAIRMEFVTRLYFFSLYFPEKIPQAFENQHREAQRHLARLQAIYDDLPPEKQVFNRMSLKMRIEQLKTLMDWLEDSRKYFQPGSSAPSC